MALSDNLRGAALMTVAMVAFTTNDTFMKAATAEVPVFEAIVLRGVLTTTALLIMSLGMGGLQLRIAKDDRIWVALRTFGEVGGTFTFLQALKHMPLANLSAILQFLPLAVTLTAALLFGEKVGWRRMTAIAVGFVGVMLIVRPGTEGFDRWSILGLLSVACVVIRDLATRRISTGMSSVTVAFLAGLSVTVGAALMLPFTAVEPVSALRLGQLVGAAGFLIVGYLTVVMAMRVGDVAVIAPFRYTSLVAAIILGWLVFHQWPDGWTLLGSAIVVATGIYTFYRERRLGRQKLQPTEVG
jgi:drug/metabolite transporter (DMT)-like permease